MPTQPSSHFRAKHYIYKYQALIHSLYYPRQKSNKSTVKDLARAKLTQLQAVKKNIFKCHSNV